MLIAERIRKIREAHQLTQEEVAFKCGISPSAYGQIERKASNASYRTLQKIAKALDVSLLFMLDVENLNFKEENKL